MAESFAAAKPSLGAGLRRRLGAWRRWGLNPMMYKELTQGIRNNGFVALFFLLLAVSWMVLVGVVVLARTDAYIDGYSAAQWLMYVIFLFGLIIGARAFGLTVKEVDNRTFELYLVAGMSPEQLVRGKVITCLYLFMFGFFTVVPFVFASYFLSGLDFFIMLWFMLLMVSVLVFYYFASILMAMIRSLTATRTIVTLLYYASMGLLFFFGTIFAFQGREMHQFMSSGFQDLLASGDVEAYSGLAIYLIFYIELMVLMFYWACHIVCPESDSREHILKLHLTALALLLAGFPLGYEAYTRLWLGVPGGSYEEMHSFFAFTFLMAYGLILLSFWVNREEVPMLTASQIHLSRGLKRLAYFLFEPGVRGTGRLLLLLLLAGLAMGASAAYLAAPSGVDPMRLINLWAMPAALLFMAVLWRSIFEKIGPLRRTPGNMRTALIVFWSLAAIAAWMTQIILRPNAVNWELSTPAGIFVGWFITPLMTVYALQTNPIPEFTLGLSAVLGLVAAIGINRRSLRAPSLAHAFDDDRIGGAEAPREAIAPRVEAKIADVAAAESPTAS